MSTVFNYFTVARPKEGSNTPGYKAPKSPEVHVLIPSHLRRGDTAEIFCSLRRGSLPVAFRWVHNGRSIGDSDDPAAAETAGLSRNIATGRSAGAGAGILWKIDHRDRRSELLIENIGAHQIGNYTCIASNAAGKTSFTASLLVDVPPTWLESPGDRAAVVGSSLTVDCVALGHPTPVAKWTRIRYPSDSPVRDKDDRLRVLANGSLSIVNVEPEDSGLFRCDVENGVGATLTKTVNLTVSVPPKIRKSHQATKVRLGNIVKLHCSATGEDPLKITWAKDGKSIERTLKERYDVIERSFPGGIASDLLIHKSTLSDAGRFSCEVSNRFGAVTGQRPLFVLELPSPPIGVRVDDVGKRTARVSWKKPFAEVNHFLLRYWRENGRGRKLSSSSVSGAETSTYLQDLQPGTEYSGHIVSQNDVGLSGPSVSMRFITSEEAPSAPPTDVHSTPIGEKEIMVTWKGPPNEHRNGKIQGYYVGYKVHDSGLPYNYQTVTGGAESVVIKDLKPSTVYSVVVQAFNRAGQSPSSHQISVQPFVTGLPDPPTFSTSEVTCCSVMLTITSRQKPTDSITLPGDVQEPGPGLAVALLPSARPPRVAARTAQGHAVPGARGRLQPARKGTALQGRRFLRPSGTVRTWDEDGAVEEAEVPFYLRAGVLVPVAVSLGIIVISVVAAFAYYRRSLATHGSGVKYESCVQSREPHGSSWPATSRASFARRSVAESSVYDTPWDAQAALAQANQAPSIYDGNYTRLKGRGSNSHLALECSTSAVKNHVSLPLTRHRFLSQTSKSKPIPRGFFNR
uniref:SDscam-r2 n=1 Tax=Ixodes scapularis TaxID=6945 RepID=A0A344AR46_IXOSC|nr:sDscam-r2 [Ixodes scapularis]